jgi:hypothetical protein
MLTRRRLLPISFALLGLACSSATGPVFEPQPYPREAIRAHVREVNLRDARKTTNDGNFDTPIVSLPGQHERAQVRVAATTVQEMKRRLGKLIAGGKRQFTVNISIAEGEAGWSSSWTSETAFASVKLEVEFRNAVTGAVLLSTFGEAWGRRSSLDVSDGESNQLFQAAALAAFDRAVASQPALKALSTFAEQRPGEPTVQRRSAHVAR